MAPPPPPESPDLPQGSDALLGNLSRDELLARAVAMGVPAFVRRARAVETALEKLHAALEAERDRRLRLLRLALARQPAGSPRARELVARANVSWRKHVATVSLEEVHTAQTAYNLYYAIEREMALPGAPRAAVPRVELLTRGELEARHGALGEGEAEGQGAE